MNKSRTKKVNLPADILAELQALPSGSAGTAIRFTEEQDAIILSQWQAGTHKDALAEWFKKRYGFGCTDTLRKRYKELTK